MEAHLDATLASIINQTVLEQIIDSKRTLNLISG